MVVARSAADLARHKDVRQEVHLHLDYSVAAAVLAASAFDIEAEASRLVASDLGLRHLGKQVADVREHAGVCRRIRARRLAYRRLVDVDDLVEVFYAFYLAELARLLLRAVGDARDSLVEYLVHKARLARARHARYEHQLARRDLHVYVLEVVLGRAEDLEVFARAVPAHHRHRDVPLT